MKVVLTIAGSDSSGGAGIQADLKTFEVFGVFGASAITVVTAQNTQGVKSLVAMTPLFIREQIEAVLEDFDVTAIKIGMLYSKEIIEVVGDIISKLDIPIVLDPVFISKVNSPLLQEDAIEAIKSLFAHVSLITPNKYEAHALFGFKHADSDSLAQLKIAPCPILIKHQVMERDGQKISIDQLFYKHEKRVFQTPMFETTNLHGTGCSYSSAIAANLALGHPLEKSIEISKAFIYHAILNAPNIGHGAGPIHHKVGGIHAL